MLRKRIIKHGIFGQIGSYACTNYDLCTCNSDTYCACDDDRECNIHFITCKPDGCMCDSCASVCNPDNYTCSTYAICEKYYCVEIIEKFHHDCTVQCLPLK